MLRLLKFLITGNWYQCRHEWEEMKDGGIVNSRGTRVGNFHECRCTKCGSWKVFNLK